MTASDVRDYRLHRVQEQLQKAGCPAILLYDPVNIRYATDTSNMQIWTGSPCMRSMPFSHARIDCCISASPRPAI